MVAIALIIISTACTIVTKEVENLLIMLGSVYFLGMAVNLVHKWKTGRIEIIPALCVSIQEKKGYTPQRSLELLFSVDADDTPSISFVVPQKGCKFIERISYILYIDKNDRTRIIASEPVA